MEGGSFASFIIQKLGKGLAWPGLRYSSSTGGWGEYLV